MDDPKSQYQQRHQSWQQRVRALDAYHYRLGNVRLLVFLALLVVFVLILAQKLAALWLWAPLLGLAVLLPWHQQVARRWGVARQALSFYEEGLARLEHRWQGKGPRGQVYAQPEHPYAADLDLFGKGSLFDFLCRARTLAGQDCLAQWLLSGAPVADLRARQEAIQELRPRLDLREEVHTLVSGPGRMSVPYLAEWGEQPCLWTSSWPTAVCGLLGLAGLACLGYWIWSWNPWPLALMVLLQQAYLRLFLPDLPQVLVRLEPLEVDCRPLRLLLQRLEVERVSCPLLQELWLPLREHPSRALAQLERLLQFLESRRNLFAYPLVTVSMATPLWSLECERWRRRHGSKIAPWVESLAQFEALSSLASLAWENPGYCWPEFLETGQGLEADNLGHPLLGAECVGNSLCLRQQSLWVISGSNMAGKSSLLRALGSNVVLAMAGGPVRADRLALELLRPAASIQLSDSLSGGISRFYAEILRLRQIVELAREQPRLLFLLDEMMSGTNSHDRRIGATALLKSLVEGGALGLVTTHDLALTEIVSELGDRAANWHLQDQLVDGQMSFDYCLRQGVVEKSNALELMRAVGLDV